MIVLYAGRRDEAPLWEAALRAVAPEFSFAFSAESAPPDQVEVILYAPSGPLKDFSPYKNLRFILSLWAGVEGILANPALPSHVPLARMVDAGMTQGMSEYIVGHALRIHLGMDAQRQHQARGLWRPVPPPLAGARPVGVLGQGELGAAAARALAGLGFPVMGWSRTPKAPAAPGVEALSGPEGLDQILSRSQILAALLPLTPETRGILNAARLARLPAGAHIINAARGAIIDETALRAALDSGALGGATLDVFAAEPLAAEHPFWRHPRVTVTPHVASITRPSSAAATVAAQLRRIAAGEPLLHLVDRRRGY